MTLNANLVEIDDCVVLSLPPNDERYNVVMYCAITDLCSYGFWFYSFVFDGLPDLIAHMVISNAAYIKRLNRNGVRKMVRNILALQQNLLSVLSVSQCAPLERGREYYSLFGLGPEVSISNGMFEKIKFIANTFHSVTIENDTGYSGKRTSLYI